MYDFILKAQVFSVLLTMYWLEKAFAKHEMKTVEELNDLSRSALMETLGIRYTLATAERVEATMPVDERTRQPFGVLHGGATLALAETVAGLGSLLCLPEGELAVGMQVSGNHVSPAPEGDTVRAIATPIHIGLRTHVWNVDVFTSEDVLVSTVRVVNYVVAPKATRTKHSS